jgi:hypothetical protein
MSVARCSSRYSVTAESIESSLSVAPSIEHRLFSIRDKFDLVVMYDERADLYGPQFKALARAIYEMAFQKMLKRMPVLLIGGLAAWKQEFGDEGVVYGTPFDLSEDGSGRGRPRRHREHKEHHAHATNGTAGTSSVGLQQAAGVELTSPVRHRSHTESAASSRMPSIPRNFDPTGGPSRVGVSPLGKSTSPQTQYPSPRPGDGVRGLSSRSRDPFTDTPCYNRSLLPSLRHGHRLLDPSSIHRSLVPSRPAFHDQDLLPSARRLSTRRELMPVLYRRPLRLRSTPPHYRDDVASTLISLKRPCQTREWASEGQSTTQTYQCITSSVHPLQSPHPLRGKMSGLMAIVKCQRSTVHARQLFSPSTLWCTGRTSQSLPRVSRIWVTLAT